MATLILNNSDKPTFLSSGGHSNIDLTLTNAKTLSKINELNIEDYETNSDHLYITFTLNFTRSTSNP